MIARHGTCTTCHASPQGPPTQNQGWEPSTDSPAHILDSAESRRKCSSGRIIGVNRSVWPCSHTRSSRSGTASIRCGIAAEWRTRITPTASSEEALFWKVAENEPTGGERHGTKKNTKDDWRLGISFWRLHEWSGTLPGDRTGQPRLQVDATGKGCIWASRTPGRRYFFNQDGWHFGCVANPTLGVSRNVSRRGF